MGIGGVKSLFLTESLTRKLQDAEHHAAAKVGREVTAVVNTG